MPGEQRINPDPASTAVELMQCQSLFLKEVRKQQEDRSQMGSAGGRLERDRGGAGGRQEGGGGGGGVEEQKMRGREWGSRGRESPTSAVTTTRSAAVAADCDCCSNKADSCHKHLLLNMTHTHTHCYCSDVTLCCPALWRTDIFLVLALCGRCDCPLLSAKYDSSITHQIKMFPHHDRIPKSSLRPFLF